MTQLDGVKHLYGRSKESKLLLEAYSRCRDGRASGIPECVLITGSSGMGKTSLVHAVLRPTVAIDRGIFLSGKFELSPHYQPYEVIVSTFSQLADQLLVGDDRLYDIQLALADALGDEVRILVDFIPGLESVVGKQERGPESCIRTESLSRFHNLFCKFCRVISSIVPLVVFLDDMQWCDHASLELIQALLRPKLCSTKSYSKSSLLLVVASRGVFDKVHQESNNEEKLGEESSPSVNMINNFLSGAQPSRNISRIHLSSLSEAETRELIAHNFGLTTEAANILASRAFAKCCGNILHTLQYTRSILPDLPRSRAHDQQQRDENKDDENEIEVFSDHQDTVERLILKRVRRLPLFLQTTLQMAACMGNVISETALSTVTESTISDITNWLEVAAGEELLELVPNRSYYRFVHDSVRQALLSMIDDKNEMSFRIGHILWLQSSESDKDSNLFTIVNLLNKGIGLMTNQVERRKVAELNLTAGRKAASKVSFRDASRYYNFGIDFLKSGDCWDNQYELALQLHNAAASAELANQNFQRIYDLIEEIFQHARCFNDKLDAYANQIVAIGQQGKVVEATNIGLDVLRQLGEKVPTQTEIANIRPHVIETERALRGRSNADILCLPDMEDAEKLTAMRFLGMLIPYALEAGSPYANWIATRMVRLTLSHGLSQECAHGFASYARFICATNARIGYNYGQLAASLVEKCGAKDLLPRIYVSIYSMTSLWTRPLRESLDPLHDAFDVAVENGDVEYALLAAYFRSLYSVYVGMNLVQVEQLMKETKRQLKFYKQSFLLTLNDIPLQFIYNLTGKSDDPKILSGDAFRIQDHNHVSAVAFLFHGFSSKLAYLFGDFDEADQSAKVMFEMNLRAPFTSYAFAVNQFQIKSAVESRLTRTWKGPGFALKRWCAGQEIALTTFSIRRHSLTQRWNRWNHPLASTRTSFLCITKRLKVRWMRAF